MLAKWLSSRFARQARVSPSTFSDISRLSRGRAVEGQGEGGGGGNVLRAPADGSFDRPDNQPRRRSIERIGSCIYPRPVPRRAGDNMFHLESYGNVRKKKSTKPPRTRRTRGFPAHRVPSHLSPSFPRNPINSASSPFDYQYVRCTRADKRVTRYYRHASVSAAAAERGSRANAVQRRLQISAAARAGGGRREGRNVPRCENPRPGIDNGARAEEEGVAAVAAAGREGGRRG